MGGMANELGTTEMKRYEAEKRGERRERNCGNNAGGEEKVRVEEVNKDDKALGEPKFKRWSDNNKG